MPPSPIKVGFGLLHIAAASACVILDWMAAESACPQRRAEPKSLTERYVTVVPVIEKYGVRLIEPNQLQRYKIHSRIQKKKDKTNR